MTSVAKISAKLAPVAPGWIASNILGKTEESVIKGGGHGYSLIMVGSGRDISTDMVLLSSIHKKNQEAKAAVDRYSQGKKLCGTINHRRTKLSFLFYDIVRRWRTLTPPKQQLRGKHWRRCPEHARDVINCTIRHTLLLLLFEVVAATALAPASSTTSAIMTVDGIASSFLSYEFSAPTPPTEINSGQKLALWW